MNANHELETGRASCLHVRLIDHPSLSPLVSAKHAASVCYQATLPLVAVEETEQIAEFVRTRLYETGHHTTMEHGSFTFEVSGLAIADATWGLHLCHPFYNSDQRSGRYCASMFEKLDLPATRRYVEEFWGREVEPAALDELLAYCEKSFETYQSHLAEATDVAVALLREERPRWSPETLAAAAPKIAQEQLRVIMPTVFATALDYSIDLITLVSMWQAAYTPVMRALTDRMRDEIVAVWPRLAMLFREERRRRTDWGCGLVPGADYHLVDGPSIERVAIDDAALLKLPPPDLGGPVDQLHFTPELMDNTFGGLRLYGVNVSVVTYGQDQRHRTIRRSEPRFTGGFTAPSVVRALMASRGDGVIDPFCRWWSLRDRLPPSLAMACAPYGAMLSYNKAGSFSAFIHEQGKRLCWNAQAEIYALGLTLREKVREQLPPDAPLLQVLEPPCLRGRCLEGVRYCGRDTSRRCDPATYSCQRKA